MKQEVCSVEVANDPGARGAGCTGARGVPQRRGRAAEPRTLPAASGFVSAEQPLWSSCDTWPMFPMAQPMKRWSRSAGGLKERLGDQHAVERTRIEGAAIGEIIDNGDAGEVRRSASRDLCRMRAYTHRCRSRGHGRGRSWRRPAQDPERSASHERRSARYGPPPNALRRQSRWRTRAYPPPTRTRRNDEAPISGVRLIQEMGTSSTR
jgi:hypothetical protein